jgi:multiple sugar transport system permease protein
MMLWGAGGSVLNNIAAIKNIPTELMEAARLDGAGNWQLVTKIILPLTTPMNYMALVTGVINSLQLFGQPIMLSGIGMSSVPIKPLYTYMVHTYQQIFVNLRFGYGLALTWVVFIIMVVATQINQWASKKWVHVDE